MSRYNLDFNIKRTFGIWENLKLQFEADVLNATNHPVFGAPTAVVNGSGFGNITGMAGGYNPRYVQLAGRLNW